MTIDTLRLTAEAAQGLLERREGSGHDSRSSGGTRAPPNWRHPKRLLLAFALNICLNIRKQTEGAR